MTIGIITVSPKQIVVRKQEANGHAEAKYTEATIENLTDAARVLATWMDLSYEDLASEVKRVHQKDQLSAYIRESIDEHAREMNDP